MNAGRDYNKARKQAQANADRDGQSRTLRLYAGTWWLDRHDSKLTYLEDVEVVKPNDK